MFFSLFSSVRLLFLLFFFSPLFLFLIVALVHIDLTTRKKNFVYLKNKENAMFSVACKFLFCHFLSQKKCASVCVRSCFVSLSCFPFSLAIWCAWKTPLTLLSHSLSLSKKAKKVLLLTNFLGPIPRMIQRQMPRNREKANRISSNSFSFTLRVLLRWCHTKEGEANFLACSLR